MLLGTFKGKGQTSLDVELTIPKELCMKKGKSKLTWIIWVLVIALLAVVGVMAFKQWEYGQSADYCDSLRGGQQPFSWFISSACAEGTIVQCSDNERYLNKLFDGRRNASGTLFIDYRNLTNLRDPNTLIYGHHMRNESMFGTLVFYKEQAYFESHPCMLLIDNDQIWLLELFAGYTTTSEDHCYDIAISGGKEQKRFVDAAVHKRNFASSVQVFPADHLVTLSTCAYSFENARYITICRFLPWWIKPEEPEAMIH